jgi:hypothetical protein
VWILLDHERMNYSFDIYDAHANRRFYDALYQERFGAAGANYSTEHALFPPSEFMRRSPTTGGLLTSLGPSGRGAYGRVPLEAGDALILRQVETHRTEPALMNFHDVPDELLISTHPTFPQVYRSRSIGQTSTRSTPSSGASRSASR